MITKEQAVPGTKVCIPTMKTYGGPIEEFNATLREANYEADFLLLKGYTSGLVRLTYENNAYKGSNYAEMENYKFYCGDITLYDPETANPTSHPLSNEEQAAHLHGQAEQRAEHLKNHTLLPPAVANVIAGAAHLNRGRAITDDTEADIFSKEWPLEADETKPAHYNDTAITALNVIDAWDLNFRLGNTIKYIARHQKKGTALLDLKKAQEYLALEIQRLEA